MAFTIHRNKHGGSQKGYDLALKSIELGSDISEPHVLTAFFEFGHAEKLFDKKTDALALQKKEL